MCLLNSFQSECLADLKSAISSTRSALYKLKQGDDGAIQGSITNCPINWMICSDKAAILGSGIDERFDRESYSSLVQLKEEFIARVISNVGH
jgi:hypothetical protein